MTGYVYSMAADGQSIVFKKASKKNIRSQRKISNANSSSEEDENSDGGVSNVVEDLKVLQKLRKRPEGVSSAGLALGEKPKKEQDVDLDPFKLKHGGVVDVKKIKDRDRDRTDEDENRDITDMKTTFSAETNRRDEDAEMQKYVEEQMAKLKGRHSDDAESRQKALDDALAAVPEHLRKTISKKSEDMLSNQMLSGIPEMDLGIEAKIMNIEATELARRKMIQESKKKKEKPSQFIPTNMAVNFVQHKRFNIEDQTTLTVTKKDESAAKLRPVVVGDADAPGSVRAEAVLPIPVVATDKPAKKRNVEKATDDYHFEKFKKQMRRY